MNLNINLRTSSVCLMLVLALGGTLNSCSEDVNPNVLIASGVDSSFTITPVTGEVNTYILTSKIPGVIESYWDIGYGPYLGKMTEKIVLPDAGTYTVKHIAVAAGGKTETTAHDIVVATSDPAKPNLVRGGFFSTPADAAQWTSAKLSPTGAAFWSFATGSATIHAGGGAQEGIYQAIDVVKDKEYTIDMLVTSASGSDETWFEVYAGTTVPVDGVEYKDNKVMGLSTWDGCAKSAFLGRLSIVGCVKNEKAGEVSNVVKFNTTGKIYLLIRSGGNGNKFTKDGITIGRVEMRAK